MTGAAAADFEGDFGACRETPGENALLRCPTAYVGAEYEVEIESEEGSGCTSPGNPYVWYEIVNSTLPAGLSMTRAGVISGTPTSAGVTRFWIWNHDLTAAQGGPRLVSARRSFRAGIQHLRHPGLEIENETLKGPTLGQPYSETLTAKQVVTLNPPTGSDAQAAWSVDRARFRRVSRSRRRVRSPGRPRPRAAGGSSSGHRPAAPSIRRSIRSQSANPDPEVPVRPAAERRSRSSPRKTVAATGGAGPYKWSLASGALPAGTALNAESGAISGTPKTAGSFAFAVAAEDAEGRLATASVALTVAPRLTIETRQLTARLGHAYRARIATAGGVAPVKWKLSGKLPRGVRFAKSGGTLAGTPRRAGSFSVVVEARDALSEGAPAPHAPSHAVVRSDGLGSPSQLVVGRRDDAVQLVRNLRERMPFELSHALARDAQLACDRVQRLLLSLEAEAKLEEAPLALRECLERASNRSPAKRFAGFLRRVECIGIGEKVSELAVSVVADGLVERDGRFDRTERFHDVLFLVAAQLGQLLRRRLTSVLDLELATYARELGAPFVHVRPERGSSAPDSQRHAGRPAGSTRSHRSRT